MPEIKMSDLLFITAEAAVNISKKIGTPVSIIDIYHKDTNTLALTAGYMRIILEKCYGTDVTIIDDRKKG